MERDGKEQNGMKMERQNREQKQNAAEQTYGTEMIITDRNILLGNVMSERGTVTLLSIIILNECIIEFSQYHVEIINKNPIYGSKNGTSSARSTRRKIHKGIAN